MTTNHFPFIMLMILTNLEDQVLGVQGKAIELQLGWEDWLLRSDPVISIEIRQSLKLGLKQDQSVHLGRRVRQHRFIVGFHRSCFNRRRRCLRAWVLLATVLSFASSSTLLCDVFINKLNIQREHLWQDSGCPLVCEGLQAFQNWSIASASAKISLQLFLSNSRN